jgi:hypothetical protein
VVRVTTTSAWHPETTQTGNHAPPALTADKVMEVLGLLSQVDSVELKVSVPQVDRRSVVRSLGMDPLQAQLRQVVFFDTPDLSLHEHGIVVRARRIQRRAGDSIVKLRPVVPRQLTHSVRQAPGFGVEIDMMPGGFVCSGRMKAEVEDRVLMRVFDGDKPMKKVLTVEQRALLADHAPPGVGVDDLVVLGPINTAKLKFKPQGFPRRMVAELWFYPDGSQVLELSLKCQPDEAFEVAASAKAYLTSRGVDLGAAQQTKTASALSIFAAEVRAAPHAG